VLLHGYRARVGLSLLLVIAEAAGQVALPFVIGRALDEYLAGSNRDLILLAALGLGTMLLATIRRLHDVRLYAMLYQRAGKAAVEQESDLSPRTARLNLLREVVDFAEHSMPELIASVVGFIGTLLFLFRLSRSVFVAALLMAAVIMVIYALSTRRTMTFNRGYNDEYERQVDVLRQDDRSLTRHHIGLLNAWTIKLSDVDAINYALSLTLMIALQVFAIVTSARQGVDVGSLMSIVLYVFEFSATASLLPFSWQEYLRLRDILHRLGGARTE
jgi:hypothetical protein